MHQKLEDLEQKHKQNRKPDIVEDLKRNKINDMVTEETMKISCFLNRDGMKADRYLRLLARKQQKIQNTESETPKTKRLKNKLDEMFY